MSSYTKNINLFKHDVTTDAEKKFDINKALNENWDKIDEYIENVEKGLSKYSLITNTGSKIVLEFSDDFKLKISLITSEDIILCEKEIQLPINKVVTNVEYISNSKSLKLSYLDKSDTSFPISDIINGLATSNDLTTAISNLTKDIQNKLDKKVDKVTGKGLSTNDYTNTEKSNNAENTKVRHTHSNKIILDEITSSYTTEKDEQLNKNTLDVSNLKADSIEQAIKNYFAITPDDGIYTIRFPKWETSHSCECEKLDKNADKFLNLATDTKYEETNYGPAFDTIDCNAYVDENGIRHITALKGMSDFKDTGKVDVFVLGRTYYQKMWEDDEYIYYSRTYMPKEGYTVTPMSINKDGSISPYWLIAKYVAGEIADDNGTHKLYSSKGLLPAHYFTNPLGDEEVSDSISYEGCINIFKRRGKYYSAAPSFEYLHILTTIWLKLGTRNSQSVLAGNTINSYQYKVAVAEENVSRVILTTVQANNIDLHSYISVGDPAEKTDRDRRHGYMHNIALDCEVIGKEEIDNEHVALILNHTPFTTTETSYISTMHEKSGYSDYVLGRNGSRISNTNGKHGAVLDGIECFVGGYEVVGNAVVDIDTETGNRVIYTTNDVTKLKSAIAIVKSTYKKILYEIPSTSGGWKYITKVDIDLENGIAVPTSAGETGGGSGTGFADGLITDASTSGQRELLLLGHLASGAPAGVSVCRVHDWLGGASWNFLARPSINLVGGELAES